jgi:hypothetical protein
MTHHRILTVQRPTKEHILREIRRTTDENNGVPLGKDRFATATGIGESAWRGRHWARYGDAVREAGYEANQWQRPGLDDDALLRILARLTRDLGKFPTVSEVQLARRNDRSVPAHTVFSTRFGSRPEQLSRLIAFADADPEYADVAAICATMVPPNSASTASKPVLERVVTGVVYLVQMGEFHKVGKSNDVGRRIYEIGLHLPEKADLVHVIETDDPSGIEAYWHRRFAASRANGEWFRLSPGDLDAFRRRSYM